MLLTSREGTREADHYQGLVGLTAQTASWQVDHFQGQLHLLPLRYEDDSVELVFSNE